MRGPNSRRPRESIASVNGKRQGLTPPVWTLRAGELGHGIGVETAYVELGTCSVELRVVKPEGGHLNPPMPHKFSSNGV